MMKLHKLAEGDASHDDRIRADGRLKDRLKIIDNNIEMFSAPLYQRFAGNDDRLKELRAGRQEIADFYAGKIPWSKVSYRVKELTMNMPAWGAAGT